MNRVGLKSGKTGPLESDPREMNLQINLLVASCLSRQNDSWKCLSNINLPTLHACRLNSWSTSGKPKKHVTCQSQMPNGVFAGWTVAPFERVQVNVNDREWISVEHRKRADDSRLQVRAFIKTVMPNAWAEPPWMLPRHVTRRCGILIWCNGL